jgi:predicted transcriptional regulator
LHRNYKNVYDDMTALSKYGLVDLSPSGRALRPSAAASRIEISFDI